MPSWILGVCCDLVDRGPVYNDCDNTPPHGVSPGGPHAILDFDNKTMSTPYLVISLCDYEVNIIFGFWASILGCWTHYFWESLNWLRNLGMRILGWFKNRRKPLVLYKFWIFNNRCERISMFQIEWFLTFSFCKNFIRGKLVNIYYLSKMSYSCFIFMIRLLSALYSLIKLFFLYLFFIRLLCSNSVGDSCFISNIGSLGTDQTFSCCSFFWALATNLKTSQFFSH